MMVTRLEISFLLISCVIGLAVLMWSGNNPLHFHQDEFVFAYTSYTLPPIRSINWLSGYPVGHVAQYPIVFFLLQKPFLALLGPTLFAIRISTWWYYIGTIIYLFVLTKTIFHKRLAVLTTIMYVFLAPNVYFSSFALHNIASTLTFLGAFTHLLLFLRTDKKLHLWLTVLFCVLSFLFHPSSYITLPLIIVFGLYHAWNLKSKTALKHIAVIAIATLIFLSPFIYQALFIHNYFSDRLNQVNIVTGSWKNNAQTSLPLLISGQVYRALASFVLPSIGGRDGFNFGKLGLFDPFTAFLIGLGFIHLLVTVVHQRQLFKLYFFTCLLVPLILGFVLTIHPPPFHRITLVYPFFAILAAFALEAVIKRVSKSRGYLGQALLAVGVLLYLIANVNHVSSMIESDKNIYPQNTRVLAYYMLAKFPQGTSVSIAAYPAFHVGKELFFRTKGKYQFVSETTPIILSQYTGEPLILLNPTIETLEYLKTRYPKYQIVKTLDSVPLGDVTLFTP